MGYRTYPGTSKLLVKQDTNTYNYSADDFWAAAAMACRINNGYVKYPLEVDQEPNLVLAQKVLNIDPNLLSEADRNTSLEVRNYYRGLTFRILQGKNLTSYEQAVVNLVDLEKITNPFDMRIIISSIHTALEKIGHAKAKQKITEARGGLVGTIGQTVTLDIEVVKCAFSNYRKFYTGPKTFTNGCYYVTGITKDDQPVFFAQAKSIAIGSKVKIRGRVKHHHDDNITQLNYAKVITSVDNTNIENSDAHE